MKRWQFVLHQQALEEIDGLRPAERRDVRAFSCGWWTIRGSNLTLRFGRVTIALTW